MRGVIDPGELNDRFVTNQRNLLRALERLLRVGLGHLVLDKPLSLLCQVGVAVLSRHGGEERVRSNQGVTGFRRHEPGVAFRDVEGKI
jgi:hypothetical protein